MMIIFKFDEVHGRKCLRHDNILYYMRKTRGHRHDEIVLSWPPVTPCVLDKIYASDPHTLAFPYSSIQLLWESAGNIRFVDIIFMRGIKKC